MDIFGESLFCLTLYRSALPAIVNDHKLGDLNNTNFFPHSLEAGSLRSGCQYG